ncbi:MAG: DinB family protein [Chloroflexota bacterium]
MPEIDFELVNSVLADFQRGISRPFIEIASPYSIESIVRGFNSQREELFTLLDSLDDTQIVYKPADSEFSVSEVVSHMIAAQGGVYNALLDLSEIVMPFVAHTPNGPGAGAQNTLKAADAREQLHTATDEMIEVIRQVARIDKPAMRDYPDFGLMSPKSWMMFQITHDYDHLRQAKKIRAAEGFPTQNQVTTNPLS